MKHIKNFENINNETLNKKLIISIHSNNIEDFEYCIEKGADVNYYNTKDSFPLIDIISYNTEDEDLKNIKYKMAKTLLKHGANPNQTDASNYTPLIISSLPDPYFDIMMLLIDYDADWNIKNDNGEDFIDVLKVHDYWFINTLIKKYPEKYKIYLIKKEAEKYNI